MMLHALTYYNTILFTVEELACSHCGCGKLAPGFSTKLVELRVLLDEPMVPNSVCRCADFNSEIEGHPRSLHVYDHPHHPTEGCCALDVRTYGRPPEYREKLIKLARSLSWSIGHGKNFVHLDRRTDYTGLPRAEFNY